MNDSAMRARVAGRLSVAERTIWSMDVAGVRVRCVLVSGEYEVQVRNSSDRWETIKTVSNPAQALQRAVSGQVLLDAMDRWHYRLGPVETEKRNG